MARDAKGEVVALRRRAGAGLSPVAWRRFSPVEKLQVLYGLALDAALEDLSYAATSPSASPLALPLATM